MTAQSACRFSIVRKANGGQRYGDSVMDHFQVSVSAFTFLNFKRRRQSRSRKPPDFGIMETVSISGLETSFSTVFTVFTCNS